ncbi:MAG TPA: hypothetical protein VJB15_03680, partial [Rhodothermia bacterium]|nr:hypothetical protein [Rhodothermia bacterium]
MQVPDLVSAVIGSGKEEADQEFLTEVRHISLRGLATIGLLGLLGSLFYVLLHLLFLDYQPGWSYSLDEPGTRVLVMWDKLVLAVLSLVALLTARMRVGMTHGRLILALCVLGAAGGMVVDQAAGGQSEYFVGYLTLLMFAAVGSVPFRPGQTVIMCMAILALMLIVPPSLALAGFSARP